MKKPTQNQEYRTLIIATIKRFEKASTQIWNKLPTSHNQAIHQIANDFLICWPFDFLLILLLVS
jgi:hypothetical protein